MRHNRPVYCPEYLPEWGGTLSDYTDQIPVSSDVLKSLRKFRYLPALMCLIPVACGGCEMQKHDDGVVESEVAIPLEIENEGENDTAFDSETAAHRAQIQSMYESYRAEAFAGVADITVAEFLAKMASESVVLIDCREPAEMNISQIPGALTRAAFEADPESFRQQTIITYCTIGYRSGEYARDLQAQGFSVVNLIGGVLMWAHEGQLFENPEGGMTKRVHVYGEQWDLLPPEYESVY